MFPKIITKPKLSIVVPCYNEQDVLEMTTTHLVELINDLIKKEIISEESFILFIDDGSKDQTWNMIKSYSEKITYVTGLKLAKNAGHQNALLAGLIHVIDRVDCAVSIDADLQDDPNVIHEFLNKFTKGFDIVYGVRKSREKDTYFKRTTAKSFYKLMIKMGVNIIDDHADFRLMSNRALKDLKEFQEVNLFLRGLIPLIGYKSTKVYYHRHERVAGESKYPLKKMLAFSLDGITSFSITPIRLVTVTGLAFSIFSLLAGLYAITSKFLGNTVSGWTSIILSVWFIGGIQLMSLGLIGEYIGKIYKETKRRPRYFIEEETKIK
ncbi:glycosyltransferase family 2 protein [Bacillus weihaiensis]|uniref:glycosyltransferase family 2 protein n=1 Tax=Bacillus weihaiensis TaxID=1547283 RepID=UPI0023540EF0|nr:glycosyltransferase family 2 protein [Bacillus weihaiensis]